MALERQKKFTIGKKTFTANFPNIGQLIDLESLKQALTGNRYGQMAASGITSMYYALDLVDAISFYQIVIPEVAKYYDIRNYTTLQIDDMQDLMDAYKNEIKPWFDQTMSELKGISANGGDAETENND